jgi:hypothetical protein
LLIVFQNKNSICALLNSTTKGKLMVDTFVPIDVASSISNARVNAALYLSHFDRDASFYQTERNETNNNIDDDTIGPISHTKRSQRARRSSTDRASPRTASI